MQIHVNHNAQHPSTCLQKKKHHQSTHMNPLLDSNKMSSPGFWRSNKQEVGFPGDTIDHIWTRLYLINGVMWIPMKLLSKYDHVLVGFYRSVDISHCEWRGSALLDNIINGGFTMYGFLFYLLLQCEAKHSLMVLPLQNVTASTWLFIFILFYIRDLSNIWVCLLL